MNESYLVWKEERGRETKYPAGIISQLKKVIAYMFQFVLPTTN